ncbi:hypothetical protein EVAR_10429_1 [Eumeta japonica]|uniref:Uncharacterized protein n=1 Tax=Eumeta variegata TaxID=151549 RepID=A0A4C1UE00_EUMVA|nr:hypothetical protein EVAR_10429_1 [Eumeta japonica]
MLFSDMDSGLYRNECRYLAPLNDYRQRLAVLALRGPPISMPRHGCLPLPVPPPPRAPGRGRSRKINNAALFSSA